MRFLGRTITKTQESKKNIGCQQILLTALIVTPFVGNFSCSKAKFSGSSPGRGQESAPTTTEPQPPVENVGEVGLGEKQIAEAPKPEAPKPEAPKPEVPAPSPPTEPPKAPAGVTEVPKEVPQCVPSERLTGTKMVMVIDNSNSNSDTDCPGAVQNGVFRDTKLYQCTQETSRAKAALAVYDLLKEVAEKDASNPLAKSQLAVTYFPTKDDYVSGFKVEKGFTETTSQNREAFANALAFTNTPYGLTPYVAAMASVEKVFESGPSDARSKVVLFVTDGEATDRNPEEAIKKAENLMGAGIQVLTVYYPVKDSRVARIAKHTSMMREIDQNYVAAGGGHWYDEARYQSFDEYIRTIVGGSLATGGLQASTLLRISTKVDSNCSDGVALCERKSYEVADAQALSQAMKQIVKRDVIGCDPK